jgi:hypothetical protein
LSGGSPSVNLPSSSRTLRVVRTARETVKLCDKRKELPTGEYPDVF